MSTKVVKGNTNVFRDLDHKDPEEAFAKAEMARRISQAIQKHGLTQSQAARLLGTDQAKISALVRGKLAGFSTDRLIRYLTALGVDVQIVLPTRTRTKSSGKLSVLNHKTGTRS